MEIGDLLLTDLGNVAVVTDKDTYGVKVSYYKDDMLTYQYITYTMVSNGKRRYKAVTR